MNTPSKLLFSLCLLPAMALSANAANRVWDGDTSINDDWSTGTNWTGDVAPVDGDRATIDSGSTEDMPVIFDIGTGNELILGATGDYFLGVGSGSTGYLQIDSGSLVMSGGRPRIGSAGTGLVTINSGATLTYRSGTTFVMGEDVGSSGTIVVNDGGTFVVDDDNANIGGLGTALIQLNGPNAAISMRNTPGDGGDSSLDIGTQGGSGRLEMYGGSITAVPADFDNGGRPVVNVGFFANTGNDNATLIGYGTVDMRNDGTAGLVQIGGQVIADGTDTSNNVADRTLSFGYEGVSNDGLSTAANPMGSHYGWYTQNQGAIDLLPETFDGGGEVFWGDQSSSDSDWTPNDGYKEVLVNSAYLHATTSGNTADIALLDPTRINNLAGDEMLPVPPSEVAFMNIWEIELSAAKDIDIFSVRYDESFSEFNAADQYVDVLGFYYWDEVSATWTDLTAFTTVDTDNFIAQLSGTTVSISDTGYFALGAQVPEPTSAAMLLGGAGLLLMRRRRK